MKQKGFTLVELIGVVIILCLLCVLAIPPILNSINSTKNELSDTMKEILVNASELYVNDNTKKFPERDGNVYCVEIQKLIDQEYLLSPLLDPVTKRQIPSSHYVKIEVNAGIYNYDFIESCEPSVNSLMVANYATVYQEFPFLGKMINYEKFESITIVNSSQVPVNAIDSWDVSAKQNGSIKAWYLDSDSNSLYELYIGQNGGVVANPDSSNLFISFVNVKSIDLTHFDTSNVHNMSSMFESSWNLTSLDLTPLDTSNVTNMSAMFRWSKLTSLDLTPLDTSKVTDMSNMFSMTWNLKTLDLTFLDISKVINYYDMFSDSRVSTVYVKTPAVRDFISDRLASNGVTANVIVR